MLSKTDHTEEASGSRRPYMKPTLVKSAALIKIVGLITASTE
jgi:hypothetical protein